MDHVDAQGHPRNFSPLATDIMSHTSGSLDESADYLPVTTPSVEKHPQFPPLILETSASSTTPPSSPPQATLTDVRQVHSQSLQNPLSKLRAVIKTAPSWPQTCLKCWTWQGTRSRLTSDNTDPEIMRRKSVPMDMSSLVSDSLATFVQR